MAPQTLATGTLLVNFPATLSVTTTVPPFYTIVSGDTWPIITQKLYGTNNASVIAALQAFAGTTSLPPTGQRINIPNPLQYTSGGAGSVVYQRTEILDALGATTTYLKDTAGRLVAVLRPSSTGTLETRYTYDAATGNVATVTEDPTGLNRVTTFTYDSASGLLLNTRDALGNTVAYAYNTSNQLESVTRYTVRDPDGAGSGQPSGALTTRYVYDAEHHLRFEVSADGRVIEHIYDAPGQRTTTYEYASSVYSGAYTESALNTWATNAARRGGPLERTDFT
jgi:YD repeat-containing protein